MSYLEKMDVLDLIIETLKEHEKALDEIVSRLDARLNKDLGNSREPRSSNGSLLDNWR
jgi:chaperonin cofactor prefoldin